QLIREIRSVQLLNTELDRSQRRWPLHFERDRKQAAVLKAFGRRARRDDTTQPRVEHSHTGGQSAFLQEREPSRIVGKTGLEAPDRLQARTRSHHRRNRDRRARWRVRIRDGDVQDRVAPLWSTWRREGSRVLYARQGENRDGE